MSETRLFVLTDIPHTRREGPPSSGYIEAQLGKIGGLSQFGANFVTLEPGAFSSSRHWHEAEDELVYMLSGELTLIDDNGPHLMRKGGFVAFPAGVANAHHIVNQSNAPGTFLVIGSRRPGEETIHYPDDSFGPIHK